MKAMKTTMSIGTYGKLTWQCNKPTIQTSVDPIKTSIDAIETSIYGVFHGIPLDLGDFPARIRAKREPCLLPTQLKGAWRGAILLPAGFDLVNPRGQRGKWRLLGQLRWEQRWI